MKTNKLISLAAAVLLMGATQVMASYDDCVNGINTGNGCIVPDNAGEVTIEIWGAGGGGATGENFSGGGGGGGGYCKFVGSLTNKTLTFAIGNGGSGGTQDTPNDAGIVGGVTSITIDTITSYANGGNGGAYNAGGTGGVCNPGALSAQVTGYVGGSGHSLGGGGASGSPFGVGGNSTGEGGGTCANGATNGVDCGSGGDATPNLGTSPGGGGSGGKDEDDGSVGGNGQVRITWTAINNAPTITSTPITTGAKDTLYTYELNATDADGDTLTWSVTDGTTLPSWLNLSSGLTALGETGVINNYRSEPIIATDSQGIPYMAYVDPANNKINVLKYNGTSWDLVGDSGCNSTVDAAFLDFAIDGNDVPYISFSQKVDFSTFGKTFVMKYESNQWSYVGNSNGFSAGAATYTKLLLVNNIPYVSYHEYINPVYKISVQKYNTSNSTWEYVGGQGLSDNNTGTYMAFNKDSQNNLYIVYDDIDSSDSSRKATAKKFNDTNSSWELVGDRQFTPSNVRFLNLDFDSADTPYISFEDASVGNKRSVMKYANNAWSYVGSAGISEGGASKGDLVIDDNDNVYAAYTDAGINHDYLGKIKVFNGTSWDEIDTSLIEGMGDSPFFALSDDAIYVAFKEYETPDTALGEMKVFKLANGAVLSGTPTELNGATASQDVNLTLSDGNGGVVSHNFTITLSGFNNPTTFSALTPINTDDNVIVKPFENITLSDDDSTEFNATITLDDNDKGTLSATTIATGSLSEIQTALRAITFTPAQNIVAVGTTTTTTITLTVTADGNDAQTTNSVVSTSVNDENNNGSTTSTPINGTCGASNGITTLIAPSTNLCSIGTITSVTSNSTTHSWSCNGIDGGTADSCSANKPIANINTGGGSTAVSGLGGTTSTTNINNNQVLTSNTTNTGGVPIVIEAELPTDTSSIVKTKHKIAIGGKETVAISKLEATVDIKLDKSVETKADINTTQISVIAKPDGTAEHTVTLQSGKISKATSDIVGAKTEIKISGEVETMAGDVNATESGYTIKAVAITKVDGTTLTRFIKVNTADETDITILGNTVTPTTPFEAGNNVQIEEISGTLYMKIEAPLSDVNLEIE
jgi:hypothetical protein